MANIEKLKTLLESFWLENSEAITYLEYLKMGTKPASVIANKIWIWRTTIRHTCEILVKKGLMISSKKWNTKYFTPEPPEKIRNLLIIEKNKIEEKQNKLEQNFAELKEIYNPYTKNPKMTYYEWEDWIKKILSDHLKNNIEVLSFIDMNNLMNLSEHIQDWYAKKRINIKIKKKILATTSKEIEEKFSKKEINKKSDLENEVKFIENWKNFYVASYLYEWKFSYITLKKDKYFWAIIEDEEIYNFQKNLFEIIWNNTK